MLGTRESSKLSDWAKQHPKGHVGSFADAAKACGSELTRECVIEHAGSQTGWTAGGIQAPVDTKVGGGALSTCVTLLQATPDGFVLVPDITKPNQDIFNCDPANVVDAADTYTSG